MSPIVVSMPPARPFTVGAIDPATFRNPPVSDPSWQLRYRGFMYLMPLAARAIADGNSTALATMVGQLVAFHRADPDPNRNAYGWDEGTAQRRLQVENCLYSATRDSRLVAGMTADVNVQLGWRYYGPPRHPVHNHGVMANLRIIDAGRLLGHSSWISTGMTRLRNESVLAFSAQGTCWEQAAQYQKVNADLWTTAARVLGNNTALTALTAKAERVASWFTEPDGRYVQIGDSDAVAGRTVPASGRVFRDDAAGYVVGRWSWSDPSTTYYTLRYGPPLRAHGQPDRGGVTWSTAGMRVLVDPGRFGYDSSAYSVWRMTPSAHNVAVPDVGTYRENSPAWIASATVWDGVHRWLVDDTLYGTAHARTVTVDNRTRRLAVTDRYPAASVVRQYWHLAPAWRLVVSRPRSLVFANGSHVLTVTTNGQVSAVWRGVTRPVAGWNFPRAGVRTPAYEIVIRSAGPAVTTTFAVV